MNKKLIKTSNQAKGVDPWHEAAQNDQHPRFSPSTKT